MEVIIKTIITKTVTDTTNDSTIVKFRSKTYPTLVDSQGNSIALDSKQQLIAWAAITENRQKNSFQYKYGSYAYCPLTHEKIHLREACDAESRFITLSHAYNKQLESNKQLKSFERRACTKELQRLFEARDRNLDIRRNEILYHDQYLLHKKLRDERNNCNCGNCVR